MRETLPRGIVHAVHSGAPRPSSPALAAAVGALRIDALSAEVLRALREAGCRAIVLKGPAFRHHLYGDGALRPYGDVDLLVAPADLGLAGATLTQLGYGMDFDHRDHPIILESHAQEWAPAGGPRLLDLHWRVPGVAAPPERAWGVLSARVEPILIGGESAEALRADGIALLTALHAAHHGRAHAKSLRDLERALDRLDAETWASAGELAAELDAGEAFAEGLRLVPAGERLASALGLATPPSPERRLLSSSPPAGSVGLLRILRRAPARDRLRA